jgi:hypothetical protein
METESLSGPENPAFSSCQFARVLPRFRFVASKFIGQDYVTFAGKLEWA